MKKIVITLGIVLMFLSISCIQVSASYWPETYIGLVKDTYYTGTADPDDDTCYIFHWSPVFVIGIALYEIKLFNPLG